MKISSLRSHTFLFILFSMMMLTCTSPVDKDKPAKEQARSKSAGLYVPDDLEVTVWAETPMFHNPTNMDVDVKGRIWVTEAVNYRDYNNKGKGVLHRAIGDRILILADTDQDGKADSSKVFVEDKDLISPVGIAVIGNRVIVSCSPHLIIYTDENGDDVPDKKEMFLKGFGGKDHDHSLHAVYAGPDGNWYFNVGNAGPHVVTDKSGWTLRSGSMYTGGSPYNLKNQGGMKSDDGKVWVGGLALRIGADGRNMKVIGHNFRNAYEIIPDSYGNIWQNDNDDQVVACRTTWLMEGGNAGFFSTDGTRSWQADQRPGQDIFDAHWHQQDPGVMPAGDCSGAGAPTGVTVIESDDLGDKYRGMLLSADAGRNMIFGYHPKIKMSGYDLGKHEYFISSIADGNERYVWNDSTHRINNDKWFRPSDVTIGTDGAIYISDWYDPVVGGHQMQDSVGIGKIYRVTTKGKKMVAPSIDLSTTDGQLQALKSAAINVRNAGFERLKNQGEKAVAPVLKLLDDNNPYIQARAIWLLSQLGNTGMREVERLLTHEQEMVRATAYRALRQVTADILPYASKMATDASPFVRREVAVSLNGISYEKTKLVILSLIKSFDGNDRWYLETLGSLLDDHASTIYPEIKKLLALDQPSTAWSKPMAMLAWRLHPREAINDLSARAGADKLSIEERQQALTALSFINDKEAVDEMFKLTASTSKEVAASAKYWLSFRQHNDWATLTDWNRIKINTAYERKLAEMKVKAQILLDERQADQEHKWKAHEMAMDSLGAQLLIGLAAEDKLPRNIYPYVEEKIFNNPDASIRAQAGNYFKHTAADKNYSVSSIMKLKPDASKGRMLFSNNCAPCHSTTAENGKIGPDLSSITKKFDDTQLLDAIINPSAAIVFGYEPYLVNTATNESYFGFLISENERSLTVKDIAGNNHTLDKNTILSRKKQARSLMPEPSVMGLREQDLSDIVGFLKSQQSSASR